MVELSQLWLPVLVSAVVVFFLSFLMWMVSPHHRKDWGKLPDEDRVMNALRESGARGGQYAFPHCASPADMKDPAYMARYDAGPKGFLILKPAGPESMGKAMGTSFVFNLVTALLVAYVATLALPVVTEGRLVFRFVTTVAFLANAFGLVWGPIWFGRTWGSVLREMFDGLVYGAATGAVFLLLWPS